MPRRPEPLLDKPTFRVDTVCLHMIGTWTRYFCALLWLVSHTVTRAEVLINEIHYDPYQKTELLEFIELHNTSAESVDLSGWELTEGVSYKFPAGTTIPANGFIVVAENPANLQARFGATALGPWFGLLDNHGETITLRNAAAEVVDKVDYKIGFPWPIVGDAPGFSIELANSSADNDLGSSWRPSGTLADNNSAPTLIAAGSSWRLWPGSSAPSDPETAWRLPAFNDGAWLEGATPVGYDVSFPMGTTLSEMRGSYTSVFLRKKFTVDDPALVSTLTLEAVYDDGFKVFINGRSVLNAEMPATEVSYTATAPGPARESNDFAEFTINNAQDFLVKGENVIAVQLHNIHISNSSDCFIDLRLKAGLGNSQSGPTPGRINVNLQTNLPPQLRQVEHSPKKPRSNIPVLITVKATDPDGVATVQLQYQVVDPGSYIELNDPAYQSGWTTISMNDAGTGGDLLAGDSLYSAILPGTLQTHRRLIRYRFIATDAKGKSIQAPYADDPSPNFAYFVYDGVPAWNGAIQPGSADQTRAQVVTYSSAEMNRLPTYHLVAKKASVETSTWYSRYTGDAYPWWGTLVYDGEVYDHVRYRARGGVWRYAMGKNMWKFDFNRGHDFQARDNWGEPYKTKWRKLNLGANIQQGDYLHRGEQGMFEGVGFRLFNLAGLEAPKTHNIQFRVIDESAESTAGNQYNSDFWGLYLAIEQEDGRFLDEHDLPDGNLYKMEGGTGELNNLGRAGPSDKSDLNSFLSTYRSGGTSTQWWRDNVDLKRYFSYQAIVQGIHHYDICYGKNYFYFHNPLTSQWSVHSWDLDLTWASNMYGEGCDGVDDIKRYLPVTDPLGTEYRNRLREVRDLLFNTDQAWKVIDEHAALLKGTNSANILGADRAMWDYNPIMNNSSIVNTSKAGQGRFYQFPNAALRGSFDGAVQLMKNYVVTRSTWMDNLARDTAIPSKPQISYAGTDTYPVNNIVLRSSSYQGQNAFGAMMWRIGEVRPGTTEQRGIYEIEPVWESAEQTTFTQTTVVPAGVLRVGHEYRARVRMKDVTGRWSNWSDPLEFVPSQPDNAAALRQHLRITELMYNPPAGNDFEFIELQNTSTNQALDISGVAFTQGIDFIFPEGSTLSAGEYALLVRSSALNNFAAFRQHYSVATGIKIFGPYAGALSNDGEQLNLKTATAGEFILSFAFNDAPHWPVAADGGGHSLVPMPASVPLQDLGSGEYPFNWRASTYIKGSPGQADPTVSPALLISEISAHTDYSDPARPEYNSNDWIELKNSGAQPLQLENLYLSDDPANLKKWRIPVQTLNPGTYAVFDEVTGFHNPITNGFGLDKAGEQLLLSHLPGTSADRVVDAVKFRGQSAQQSLSRINDSTEFFTPSITTRGTANQFTQPGVVISELHYSPAPDGTNDVSWQEFIELQNRSTSSVTLGNTNGTWRLDGDVSFPFPPQLALAPGEIILVLNFSPTNSTQLTAFKNLFAVPAGVRVFGPFNGKLDNVSDRVALEIPDAPDLPGEPLVWMIHDEVIYWNLGAWPRLGPAGQSIHRRKPVGPGNSPTDWTAANPSPGQQQATSNDRDSDGMPDDWEDEHGLNPDFAADAAGDLDGDGLLNLAEYLAGTLPNNNNSNLRLEAVVTAPSKLTVRFQAAVDRAYFLQYQTDVGNPNWLTLREVPKGGSRLIEVEVTHSENHRFYRIVLAP